MQKTRQKCDNKKKLKHIRRHTYVNILLLFDLHTRPPTAETGPSDRAHRNSSCPSINERVLRNRQNSIGTFATGLRAVQPRISVFCFFFPTTIFSPFANGRFRFGSRAPFSFFSDRQNDEDAGRVRPVRRVDGRLDLGVRGGGLDLGSRPVLFVREPSAVGTRATDFGSAHAHEEPVGLPAHVAESGLVEPERYYA